MPWTPVLDAQTTQEFVVCTVPDYGQQVAFGEPRLQSECTYRIPLTPDTAMPGHSKSVQDFFSCDGRALIDQQIRYITATLPLSIVVTAKDLGGITADALGAVAAPVAVVASSSIQVATLVSAAGGTFRLAFRGHKTTPLAWNAAAATVQTALQALPSVGSGNMTVAGAAGGPYTITAAGALAGLHVRRITVLDGALTPDAATASVLEPTSGGPSRTDHEITMSSERQLPARTFVVGTEGGPFFLMEDMVARTLSVARTEAGIYTATVEYVGYSNWFPLTGFSAPGCVTTTALDPADERLLFGATDMSRGLKAWTFGLDNVIDVEAGRTGHEPFPTRLEAARLRPAKYNFTREGQAADANFLMAWGEFGRGATGTDLQVRVGRGSDGVLYRSPETRISIADGEVMRGSGGDNRLALSLDGTPWNTTGAADRPVHAHAYNQQTGAYLETA